MADRIYKGRLQPLPNPTFPEAACDFHKPHAAGLVPFEMVAEVLGVEMPERDSQVVGDLKAEIIGGALMLTRGDVWVRITPGGVIEIGIAGV